MVYRYRRLRSFLQLDQVSRFTHYKYSPQRTRMNNNIECVNSHRAYKHLYQSSYGRFSQVDPYCNLTVCQETFPQNHRIKLNVDTFSRTKQPRSLGVDRGVHFLSRRVRLAFIILVLLLNLRGESCFGSHAFGITLCEIIILMPDLFEHFSREKLLRGESERNSSVFIKFHPSVGHFSGNRDFCDPQNPLIVVGCNGSILLAVLVGFPRSRNEHFLPNPLRSTPGKRTTCKPAKLSAIQFTLKEFSSAAKFSSVCLTICHQSQF